MSNIGTLLTATASVTRPIPLYVQKANWFMLKSICFLQASDASSWMDFRTASLYDHVLSPHVHRVTVNYNYYLLLHCQKSYMEWAHLSIQLIRGHVLLETNYFKRISPFRSEQNCRFWMSTCTQQRLISDTVILQPIYTKYWCFV